MTERRVVVTGGGRGIGRAIVERFARAGHEVLALGRDLAALERTRSELAGLPGNIAIEALDVTDEARVAALFDEAGPVDILVNNAGQSMSAPLVKHGFEDWNRMLEVNAGGPFLCTRAVLPGMKRRNWGRIVTVASTAGLVGHAYTAGYGASKHAALGLARVVARELAGTGVTSNAVCPTFVRTEMTECSIARIVAKSGRSADEARESLIAGSPLGRLVEPEEVAAAVFFLASDEAAAINGQALVLDGGGIQP